MLGEQTVLVVGYGDFVLDDVLLYTLTLFLFTSIGQFVGVQLTSEPNEFFDVLSTALVLHHTYDFFVDPHRNLAGVTLVVVAGVELLVNIVGDILEEVLCSDLVA